ncbi:MAG: helix-turn-helix transcriptional regulator [Clostridia bacterium]|nr:helix-turn-helix transcriptional regulator [Clostridia bacterium]MBO4517687.1 helix-turn-helix transcriptional regulator [Clostridia bacterium]
MKLKQLRDENKISQAEIAKFLNIKQNTYSQYETGKRQLSIDMLIKLAKYYNVSTDYILDLED